MKRTKEKNVRKRKDTAASGQQNSFRPKKSLGQNFLVDPRIQQKIITSCELKKTDFVLEIGPGKGVLTKAIAEDVKEVLAIEKDGQLAEQLNDQFQNSNVSIVHADILKYPIENLPRDTKVIGNLPYNIATAIIQKFIHHRHHFKVFYMTVQLEHGLRMTAACHTKAYGAFTCFVQYYTDIKKIFNIKRTSFRPIPKVQSCFMCLKAHKTPPYKCENEDLLFEITRKAFQQRRKTLVNALSGLLSKEKAAEVLHTLSINPKLRPENISLQDYVRMANALHEDKR